MRARRAGVLAAEALINDRRGVVVSVHARALNLLLDDGPLVSVLPAESPLHPWAVTAELAPRDLDRVAVGAVVRAADGRLEVGPLAVALAGLDVVDLRLSRRPAVFPAAALRALARTASPPRAPGPFEPALARALERFRAGGPAVALAALVGVGEGLTPSGDDVIVGVLAALDAARDCAPRAAAVRARLGAALGAGGARTTRVAAQMLDAAIAGLYAEPLRDLLHALVPARPVPARPGSRRARSAEPAPARLSRAVAAVLAIGHRSGGDTLRGLIAALERLRSPASP